MAAGASEKRRFRLRGKTYTVPGFDEVNIKDIIQFDQQAASMGLTARWKDIVELSQKSEGMTEVEAAGDPLSYVMLVVTIWTSRRSAGETCTFEEASEMTLSEVEWIPAPKDRQPKKATKKSASRPGSAAAVPDEPDSPEPTT